MAICISSLEKCLFKTFIHFYFFKYLFLERGEGEREGEKHQCVSLMHPLLGTWPTTQACALTGNGTSNPSVCRPVLNPLTYISQGPLLIFKIVNLFFYIDL